MIIAYTLFALSALAKTIMDLCKINVFPDKFTWLNEKGSWRNKDRMDELIFGRNIPFIEWLFHTVLVWVTDGWHFFQMLFLNFAAAGVCVQFGVKWYWGVAGTIAYKLIFQGSYTLIKLIAK